MKKNLEDNLFNIRNLDFVNKYKKNNFNLNLFLADFMPQNNTFYNTNAKKPLKQMNSNDYDEAEKIEKIIN